MPLPFEPGPDVELLDPRPFAHLGSPRLALRPHTPEACARVLAAARASGTHLLVHGFGSRQHYGHPGKAECVLDTRGLDRIVAHEPEDMTLRVEAGVPLALVQERLAKHGQFLPLDPPLPGEATIGGLISTDAAGPLQLGLGKVRDYLIGVQLARTDGELTRAGGQVVKNVAGYELCKLYTGAWGTLGVIVEATFKVRPYPRAWGALQLTLSSLTQAERAASALLDSDVEPLALELLPERTAAGVGLEQERPYALYILFGGEAPTIEWQLARARALLAPIGSVLALDQVTERVHPALIAAHKPGRGVTLRAGLLSSEVGRFCAEAEALCAGRQVGLRWAAHAGSGVVTLHLEGEPTRIPELAARLLERAAQPATAAVEPDQSGRGRRAARLAPTSAERDEATLLGAGNLVVVDAPAELREQLAPWGRVPAAAKLMRALKQRFDPAGVLNPGRFIDGV